MEKSNRKIFLFFLAFFGIWVFFNSALFFAKKEDVSLSLSNISVDVKREAVLGKPEVVKKPEGMKDISLLDASFKNKWGLNMTESYKAWKAHRVMGEGVVVAVIDTGLDLSHPEFQDRIWENPGETGIDEYGQDKASNGIDDDENGYVDDLHGWNFVHNNHDLHDNHGHGTHISGIIAASGKKVSGVAPRAKVMVLKYYDVKSSGKSNLNYTVESINYAVEMGAHIINYSGGGLRPNKEEKDAVRRARNKGILFVAAAGNEYSNSDIDNYYPADYDLNNIISVTALDRSKKVLESSNYGIKTVDIVAPGKDIYSTLPGSDYGYMTGTSQATGFVTGVATLVLSKFKDFTPYRVIEHITETGDYYEHLRTKTGYGKKINTYRALSILGKGVGLTGGVVSNGQHLKAFTSQGIYRERSGLHSLRELYPESKRALNSTKKKK